MNKKVAALQIPNPKKTFTHKTTIQWGETPGTVHREVTPPDQYPVPPKLRIGNGKILILNNAPTKSIIDETGSPIVILSEDPKQKIIDFCADETGIYVLEETNGSNKVSKYSYDGTLLWQKTGDYHHRKDSFSIETLSGAFTKIKIKHGELHIASHTTFDEMVLVLNPETGAKTNEPHTNDIQKRTTIFKAPNYEETGTIIQTNPDGPTVKIPLGSLRVNSKGEILEQFGFSGKIKVKNLTQRTEREITTDPSLTYTLIGEINGLYIFEVENRNLMFSNTKLIAIDKTGEENKTLSLNRGQIISIVAEPSKWQKEGPNNYVIPAITPTGLQILNLQILF